MQLQKLPQFPEINKGERQAYIAYIKKSNLFA